MTYIGASGLIGIFLLLFIGIAETFKSKKIDYKNVDYYKVYDAILNARSIQKKDEYDINDYFLKEELKAYKSQRIVDLISKKVEGYALTTKNARTILSEINKKDL